MKQLFQLTGRRFGRFGRVLGLLCHSFLELPAASYNNHEAAAMCTTMKTILSTEWKEIWTIGKALGLVMLLLPPASSSFPLSY
jgi:hypothetical protein